MTYQTRNHIHWWKQWIRKPKIRLIIVSLLVGLICVWGNTVCAYATAEYKWNLVNNSSGSNTTGIYIHPLDSNIMYLRLGDTGGYRWNSASQQWMPMTDWNKNSEYASNIEGMAIDPSNKNVVYYASGSGGNSGEIFKSTNRGLTFTPSKLKKPDGKRLHIKGAEAASEFERMAVDPNNGNVIYYATKYNQGLWRSTKASSPGSWKLVESFKPRGDSAKTYKADGSVDHNVNEVSGLSFVAFDKNGGKVKVNGQTVTKIIYVGVYSDRHKQTGGHGGSVEVIREGGVWRSNDGGQTWSQLSGSTDKRIKKPTQGKVASDGTLYVTSTSTVAKVGRNSNKLVDLKPPAGDGYFNSLAVDYQNPQHVIISRFGLASSEEPYQPKKNGFYRTADGGTTWQPLKVDFSTHLPWWTQFAQYVSVVTFDPHDSRKVWFGDWSHPWRCDDITAATTRWTQMGKGQTGEYVMDLATPPAKRGTKIAPLFSATIDVAGFRFTSLTQPPQMKITHVNKIGGANHHGLADAVSIDYSESDPNYMAIVGGWDHGGRGGGGSSQDNGKTWTGFSDMGLKYDNGSTKYKYGRIAVGATKQENGYPILVHIPRFEMPRYSFDFGKTWTNSKGAPSGMTPSEWEQHRTLAADKVDGKKFYAFNNNAKGKGEVYRTVNGGETWTKAADIPYDWDGRVMNNYNLKAMPGKNGEVWLGLSDKYVRDDQESKMGLYRSTDSGSTWKKMANITRVYSFAFGAPAPGRKNMALYMFGNLNGVEGLYRSDNATSLRDLANAKWVQVYKHGATRVAPSVIRGIGNIEADRQVRGRVYVGTIARGLWYGEPKYLRRWL